MTDPRQPGSNDDWTARYSATFNGQSVNGYYVGNGYTRTEVDDLDGLGQDEEIGIPRTEADTSYDQYWRSPRTLAPGYDGADGSPAAGGSSGYSGAGGYTGQSGYAGPSGYSEQETQQGLSAGGAPLDRGPSIPASDPEESTAVWNRADMDSFDLPQADSSGSVGRSLLDPGPDLSGASSAAGMSPGLSAGAGGPQAYDPDATVAAAAVSASPRTSATSSWGGPERSSYSTDYPSSEGYSVGSVASAAESRTEHTAAGAKDKGPRRARLTLRHIDPLSTLKFTLVLTIALFVVWMVAVGVLYGILNGMGVFHKINSTINDVNGSNSNLITAQIVFGAAAVIGAVNIVLFTALATVGSFIYNLCADMVGGLEVTLSERD